MLYEILKYEYKIEQWCASANNLLETMNQRRTKKKNKCRVEEILAKRWLIRVQSTDELEKWHIRPFEILFRLHGSLMIVWMIT